MIGESLSFVSLSSQLPTGGSMSNVKPRPQLKARHVRPVSPQKNARWWPPSDLKVVYNQPLSIYIYVYIYICYSSRWYKINLYTLTFKPLNPSELGVMFINLAILNRSLEHHLWRFQWMFILPTDHLRFPTVTPCVYIYIYIYVPWYHINSNINDIW